MRGRAGTVPGAEPARQAGKDVPDAGSARQAGKDVLAAAPVKKAEEKEIPPNTAWRKKRTGWRDVQPAA